MLETESRSGRPIIRHAPERKIKPVIEEQGLKQFFDSDLPLPINFAVEQFNSLPFNTLEKKALISYYFWISDNGGYDLIKEYLKIEDRAQIHDLLEIVMDDDKLVNAYEETDLLVSTSTSILKAFRGQKNKIVMEKIAEKVTDLIKEEYSEEEIRMNTNSINNEVSDDLHIRRVRSYLPREKTHKRVRRGARLDDFKQILESHTEAFGKAPINLAEIAQREDMPGYKTLLHYYHDLESTMTVPPLRKGPYRKR